METLIKSKNKTANREIAISRILNAPRELVWKVWTDPKHISEWWGPNGFTTITKEMNVRKGGKWMHTMHGPDGRDYPNEIIFTEVAEPERICYDHIAPKFNTTVTFEAQGNKTKLTMVMVFDSKEEYDFVVKEHGAIEGQKQTIARLEELLSKITGKKELTITRTFDAPLELVWKAWMDEKHIKEWWGPTGFTNPVCEWNAKAGGNILIHMKAPDGVVYPMDGGFKEIIKNEKFVFASAALDDNGKHHFDVMNTITFVKEGEKTKLILNFVFYNITTEGATYIGGAEMGWNMSLDKLLVLLNKLK
jgi:uncharacterized protein YndB with AHSA1/START domain